MKEYLKRGINAEKIFFKSATNNKWDIKHSNKEQDMFEHWDFLISKNDLKYKVDVKSRLNYIKDNQDANVLIEILNVRGNAGWICGKADYIAFELFDKFILIDRLLLLNLTLSLCKKEYNKNNTKELYYFYTRKNRKDLVTFIKLNEVLKLKNIIIFNKLQEVK